MGKYLNPGCMKFQQVLNSEIYVDKTGMISYINSIINTEQRFVCVSRPRRFGKTIAANMLAAYYGKGESRQVFTDRKIAEYENWDKYLNHFDVVRVVMTDFIKEGKDVNESLINMQKKIAYTQIYYQQLAKKIAYYAIFLFSQYLDKDFHILPIENLTFFRFKKKYG